MDIFKNKYLIVKRDVQLGSIETSKTIYLLDKFFGEEKYVAYVTSILRDPIKQLDLIISYAKKYNISVNFSKTDVDTKIGDLYIWQDVWSRLLEIGVIISPPRDAICLRDYIRNGINKKGQLIKASPHFTGYSFDIAGNLTKIVGILNKAKSQDNALKFLIKNYLVEHQNGCIHVDVNRGEIKV